MEELLKQIQTSMDSNFHQVFEQLARTATKDDIRAVDRKIAELRHAVVMGTKSLSELMAGITSHALGLEDQLEALRLRVEAIEKRLPPEAA